ncbi:MAG: TATA-box-binding protein [Candidatus Aenigmatarchaeota archaeon]
MSLSSNIKIQNIVASTNLQKDIPLNDLLHVLESSEYEPGEFPGLIYRLDDPKVASLIFRNGKINCVGAKSMKEAEEGMKKIVAKLKKVGVYVNETDIKIKVENIVASIDLKKELNLDKLAFALEGSEYEPDQFPGLVYRMTEPKVAFLLFSSGRIVCAGAKRISQVQNAVKALEKTLKEVM